MKKLIALILLLMLAGCGGGGDDIVTQLIDNNECTGHGGISLSKRITSSCDGILCNDGTCQ